MPQAESTPERLVRLNPKPLRFDYWRSFDFLASENRPELNEALSRNTPVGIFWIGLAAFNLFYKLFGREAGNGVLAKLETILRNESAKLLGDKQRVFVERADTGSFAVLTMGGCLDVDEMLERGLTLRLAVRNALNQEVVKLTGQNLTIQVGYSPVDGGGDLERQIYRALWDARQVAEGAIDLSRLSLVKEFRRVVEEPHLTTVYQPIVDLKTGKVFGWESLARGPKGSQFENPSMLFEFAEEVGKLFVLERGCREQAVRGLGKMSPGQKLFLNIHPQTLSDPNFRPGETRRLLSRHGLTPENVVFEITERHSIRDFTLFHRTLDHYRSQGYMVAIDDAGTGYSGLSRMATLRPDFIKVDRALVRGIESNPVQRALMETVVNFADRIGCRIVAEGIETATELSSLLSMGVHFGQGYYLARPAHPKPEPAPHIAIRKEAVGPAGGEWKCSIPVRQLTESAPAVNRATLVQDIKAILDASPIRGVVVVDDHRPVGLVMSHNLDRQLGSYYGSALYYQRVVERVMDCDPLCVEGSAPVEQVASQAMARERFKIYDHIIVTEGGILSGVVSVQKMLDALAKVQVEMAKGANPLTGLPGGVDLELQIERTISAGQQASLIYLDLDHFKVYNDTYGFEKGDVILRLTADICRWALKRHGQDGDMVGHIGGDDFILLTKPDKAERVCIAIIRCFSRIIKNHYRREDRQRGFVTAKGRDGKTGRFPLLSVSMGIVDCAGKTDLHQVSQRAAELKRWAKSKPGNVYVRDRRAPLGSLNRFGQSEVA